MELLEQVDVTPASDYLDRFISERWTTTASRDCASLSPPFMIADEPTAMSMSIRNGVLKLFTALSAKGVGVLLITHGIGGSRSIAHRIYVLQDGRVVEAGDTLEVHKNQNHTQTLFSSVPDPDGRFEKHHPPVASNRPSEGAEEPTVNPKAGRRTGLRQFPKILSGALQHRCFKSKARHKLTDAPSIWDTLCDRPAPSPMERTDTSHVTTTIDGPKMSPL